MSAWWLLVVVLIIASLYSPFPRLASFARLWRTAFATGNSGRIRLRQVLFLLRAVLWMPVWGVLWTLDEILFPNYRRIAIKPVFIVGQPRCGTTFLHRTLATDNETFFAVRHIEWRYPSILVQKIIHTLGMQRRLEAANYWPESEAGRMAAKMHPNTLADWEEDGIFFEENFLHHFFIFLRFPSPGLLCYLDDFPSLPERTQTRMLNIYHRVLQKVAYLRGGDSRFYLSKEVTSHRRVPALAQRYPDARFIVLVRPAHQYMASLIALVRCSTHSKIGVDPLTLAGWHEAFVRRMRDDSLYLIDLCRTHIPLANQLRVSSLAFMANPVAVVSHIYTALGLPMNTMFSTYLQNLSHQQQGRERGYDYDPIDLTGFESYDAFVRDIDESFLLESADKRAQ